MNFCVHLNDVLKVSTNLAMCLKACDQSRKETIKDGAKLHIYSGTSTQEKKGTKTPMPILQNTVARSFSIWLENCLIIVHFDPTQTVKLYLM